MGNYKRLLAFFCALMMTAGCLSAAVSVDADALEISVEASKTQDRTAYYTGNFTLTGNYVDDYLSVARAQLGRRTNDLHYSEAWCANFVNDCARLTGMPDNIIPYNYSLRASCYYLYTYMLSECNAKKIDDPADLQAGDLVFYYCPSSNFYLHVGIVDTPGRFLLEGNYSDQVRLLNFDYNYQCYMHYGAGTNFESGHVKRLYLRPNYGCKATKSSVSYDPDTYEKPTATLSYAEKEMTYHNGAGYVQAVLNQLGFDAEITKAYDLQTVKAVMSYQTSRGLLPTGVVDEALLVSLENEWTVLKTPIADTITLDKTEYNYYDTIELSAKTRNADKVQLVIKKDNMQTVIDGEKVSLYADSLGEGDYTAYFRVSNKYMTIDTNSVNFSIEFVAPTPTYLSAKGGDTFGCSVFDWTDSQYAVTYTLTVTDIDTGSTTEFEDIIDSYFSYKLPEGSYKASVRAINKIGVQTSDECLISVKEGSPLDLGDSFYAVMSIDGSGICAQGEKAVRGSEADASSKWYFKRASNGSYTIKNCYTGEMLTLTEKCGVKLSPRTGTAVQDWYIGRNDSGFLIMPVKMTSRTLCANGSVTTRTPNGKAGERVDLKMIAPVHSYTIESYSAPGRNREGSVTYICSISGDKYTRSLPALGVETPETPDATDTPDTPDLPEASHSQSSDSFTIGDINGDGYVTTEDALYALRFTVDIIKLDAKAQLAGDVNIDLDVNSADAMTILRYSIGANTSPFIGRKIISL